MPEKLKNFLSELAVDPKKLADYQANPDAAIQNAGLDDDECVALKSGDKAKVYASLTGQSAPANQAQYSTESRGAFFLYSAAVPYGLPVSASPHYPIVIYHIFHQGPAPVPFWAPQTREFWCAQTREFWCAQPREFWTPQTGR